MYPSPGQAMRCIRLERRTKNSRSSVAVAAWRVDLTLHRAQGDWLTLLLLLLLLLPLLYRLSSTIYRLPSILTASYLISSVTSVALVTCSECRIFPVRFLVSLQLGTLGLRNSHSGQFSSWLTVFHSRSFRLFVFCWLFLRVEALISRSNWRAAFALTIFGADIQPPALSHFSLSTWLIKPCQCQGLCSLFHRSLIKYFAKGFSFTTLKIKQHSSLGCLRYLSKSLQRYRAPG